MKRLMLILFFPLSFHEGESGRELLETALEKCSRLERLEACRDILYRSGVADRLPLSCLLYTSKRGVLIFDEYGETAQMVDTATGTGIHSSVAFCYQKIRKEYGAVYTCLLYTSTFSPTSTELSWTPNTTIPAQGNPSVDFAAAIYPMSLAGGEVSMEAVSYTHLSGPPPVIWNYGARK